MAKAYAHQRDRSLSPSSEEGASAGILHKRAATGVHGNGTGALRAALPELNGCGSGSGKGKEKGKGNEAVGGASPEQGCIGKGNGHASVGGARPRALDVPALSLWEQYVRANRTHPLQTKCITTGFPSRRLYRVRCAVRESYLGAAPTKDAGVACALSPSGCNQAR